MLIKPIDEIEEESSVVLRQDTRQICSVLTFKLNTRDFYSRICAIISDIWSVKTVLLYMYMCYLVISLTHVCVMYAQGLGFNKEMQGRATRKFSGGWRMRVSLARYVGND